MNKSASYIEWKSMYDDTVFKVWKDEPNFDLKKVAMILFVIKKEFKKITDNLDDNFNEIKKKVCSPKRKISFKTGKKSQSPTVINVNKGWDKENVESETVSKNTATLKSIETTVDSPDMFQNNSDSTSSNSKHNNSIMISDDEDFNTEAKNKLDSPEIKKGRRSHRVKAHRTVESPSVHFLKDLGIITTASPLKNTQKTLWKEKVSSLDKINSSLKKVSPKNTSILEKAIPSDHTPLRGTEKSKNDTLDISVIPCTPTPISKSSLSIRQNSKMGPFMSKNHSRYAITKKQKNKNKNSTLTQMFSKPNDVSKLSKKDKKHDEADYDSDETYFEGDTCNGEETIENVGLTKMLSLINRTDNVGNHLLNHDFGDVSSQDLLENPTDCKKTSNKAEKGILTENINIDLTESETADESPKDLRDINEVLAKAQGVADHQLEAEPIVRGKARKQLPGWACKECENFYGNQGLSESEVIALNKCTKHRGLYRPREDTMPGFWDLTMATQTK